MEHTVPRHCAVVFGTILIMEQQHTIVHVLELIHIQLLVQLHKHPQELQLEVVLELQHL